MRWFLPISCAVLGAIIDGARGALIGLVAGFVVALMIRPTNRSNVSAAQVTPPPLPRNPGKQDPHRAPAVTP